MYIYNNEKKKTINMRKNIEEDEKKAIAIEKLKTQVFELQKELKKSKKWNDIYYEVTKYGSYEVEDDIDLYECMLAINNCDYLEKIEKMRIFADGERKQKLYIVFKKGLVDAWKIEYINQDGMVVQLYPSQFFNSYRDNLLDDIDNL